MGAQRPDAMMRWPERAGPHSDGCEHAGTDGLMRRDRLRRRTARSRSSRLMHAKKGFIVEMLKAGADTCSRRAHSN